MEILLKKLLTGALQHDPSVTLSWLHAPSLRVPRGLLPLQETQEGTNTVMRSAEPKAGAELDSRATVLNVILEADALVISTPIYSHQPAGVLKAPVGRLLGLFADAALANKTTERQKSGIHGSKTKMSVQRLLTPRVIGFMTVGGSPMSGQITMALPTQHNLAYSHHVEQK